MQEPIHTLACTIPGSIHKGELLTKWKDEDVKYQAMNIRRSGVFASVNQLQEWHCLGDKSEFPLQCTLRSGTSGVLALLGYISRALVIRF